MYRAIRRSFCLIWRSYCPPDPFLWNLALSHNISRMLREFDIRHSGLGSLFALSCCQCILCQLYLPPSRAAPHCWVRQATAEPPGESVAHRRAGDGVSWPSLPPRARCAERFGARLDMPTRATKRKLLLDMALGVFTSAGVTHLRVQREADVSNLGDLPLYKNSGTGF